LSQQSSAARFEPPHFPSLDGVRGLAILMVIAFHLFALPYDGLAPSILSRVFSYGWLGVDLFFVLSGFLVTLTLQSLPQTRSGLSIFFRRRALRILPAYIATLLIAYLAVGPILSGAGLIGEPPHIVWYLLAAQNYLFATDQMGGWLIHYWSLAVEIQFYLIWPLLIYGRSPKSIQRLCVVLFVMALALKLAFVIEATDRWRLSYALPITRVDGFAAGAYAAMVYRGQAVRMPSATLATLFICVLAVGLYVAESAALSEASRIALFTPAAAVVSACGIIWLIDPRSAPSRFRSVFETRALRTLGKYSYGIYLLHFIGLYEFHRAVRSIAHFWSVDVNVAMTVAGFAVASLTWSAARLLFSCVEAPFLRLR
jgi:peptidoglycan/LPS O-acetylase OafA/YrhL